jgi:hypothetical protein
VTVAARPATAASVNAGSKAGASASIRPTLAALLAGVVVLGISRYPLTAWPLALALLGYAALLWRCPAAYFIVLPIVLPAADLGLWTGWTMLGESDFFVLTTLAVLLVRNPPNLNDILPAGLPGLVVLAFAAIWLTATVVGVASPLGAPPSDNVFLRPDNALRLAKGLAEALILLPFLRQRQRVHADAVTLLGWGLAAGLGSVTVIVVAERLLFAGILEFSTAYRAAGPFSSMRVGGGHIGAYAALALPFSLSLFRLRPRWLGAGLATLACACGAYTLAVTFARTAYAAGMVAMLVAGLGSLWAANRSRVRSFVPSIVIMVLLMATLAVTAAFTGMNTRFAASAADFLVRQQNWRAGLAVRDTSAPEFLFGMGLGTYQRVMLVRSPVNRPSDLVLERDEAGAYASMRVETPFFLGQKITVPDAGSLHVVLQARSSDAQAALGVVVCNKVLLYSDNCRGADVKLAAPNQWVSFKATMPTERLGGRSLLGLLRRPVEFSVFGSVGHGIDVRDIGLTDDDGRPVLVNGNFGHGLDRWVFTDDRHVAWRMLNQYLMLFFETGVLGVTAFIALAGLAFAGGIRAVRAGGAGGAVRTGGAGGAVRTGGAGRAVRAGCIDGAAVAGAVAGFMISSLFDNVLEAPRLATLFFLICLCGLMQWEADRPPPD